MRLSTWFSKRQQESAPDICTPVQLLSIDAALHHLDQGGAVEHKLEDDVGYLLALDKCGTRLMTADGDASPTQWTEVASGSPGYVLRFARYLMDDEELYAPVEAPAKPQTVSPSVVAIASMVRVLAPLDRFHFIMNLLLLAMAAAFGVPLPRLFAGLGRWQARETKRHNEETNR